MARYVDVDELALIATRVYDRFERTATTHEDTVLNKAVYETLQVIIENAPKADVAPIMRGKWIKNKGSYDVDDYYCVYHDYNCSICGYPINDRYENPKYFKYCPCCGATMMEDV